MRFFPKVILLGLQDRKTAKATNKFLYPSDPKMEDNLLRHNL